MKKIILMVILMALVTGMTMADRGIAPVPETQGIVTSTSANAVGNFASVTELQWRITDDINGLPGIPPLTKPGALYESTYTEDTQSHGSGLVLYDKELDVETSGQISGQWNVEATKQIAFVGVNGASVVSGDSIMVDGAVYHDSQETDEHIICPFAPAEFSKDPPTSCNRAKAGSTIDMTVASVRTTSTDRFVMPSSDHPVELIHNIRVSELLSDVPSTGMASAYLDILVQEGGPWSLSNSLVERIEFSEETMADGAITLFEKLMHYESGFVR